MDVIDESYDWFRSRQIDQGRREASHYPSVSRPGPLAPLTDPSDTGPADDPSPTLERSIRGGAIQALSRDALIGRSLEISSSCFTTIVSIIQGVALAILADNTFKNPSPLVYSQSLTLLLVLVCVFYTYVNVSIMLRWAPSFLDSFLPFAIASLEIPPAYFLGHVAAWNALLAALWLGASCGFFITIKWSPPSHFGKEREAHRIFHRMLGELMAIAAICGLAMGILGTLAHLFPAGRFWWGIAGVGTVLTTATTLVARTEIRSSQIHERFGVNRPPFN
jgi:hypothetical protein